VETEKIINEIITQKGVLLNEDKIIFYTVGCPHCTVLEHKLKKANINMKK
jgi:hypothetical protein